MEFSWKSSLLIGILCVSIGLTISFKINTAPGIQVRCLWWQYYDTHMKNCGPCAEICDHMELTRTEQQCGKQCSDYMVSKTCTLDQYYDDVVHACAMCYDLCNQRGAKRTTDECFQRCAKYLEKNHPSNINKQAKKRPAGMVVMTDKGSESDNKSSSPQSSSVWIALSVVSVIAVAAFIVMAAGVRSCNNRRRRRALNYTPANGQQPVDDIEMEMQLTGFPVQVSRENMHAPSRQV